MISNDVIQEIQRLLGEQELSQRAIAKRLRVSRCAVAKVASGRLVPHDHQTIAGEVPPGPPARCPGCGGFVYLPCQLCYVREFMRREQAKRASRRRLHARGRGAQSSGARRTLGARETR